MEKFMTTNEMKVQGHKWRWVYYVPIMILLGVVPLMVQMAKTEIPDERILYITNNNVDMFSQVKATWIMMMVGLILVILFLGFSKAFVKWDTFAKVAYVSTGVYAVMTLAAMGLSEYTHVAKWGLPNRAEGGIMLLCYVVIMLYTYSVVTEHTDYKYILIPLGLLVVVEVVLGYFQYRGEDLLMTEWGKQLIVPAHYAEDRAALKPLYEKGNMYGTMFHYNYIGSFAAMLVPLFAILTAFLRDYKWKLFCGIATLASIGTLFLSTARSGLIGVACAVGVALMLFIPYFIKRWKVTLSIVIATGVFVLGANAVTQGAIFRRIPTLVADIVAVFTPQEEVSDYKQTLPLQDIVSEEGKTTLYMGDETLTMMVVGEAVKFYDTTGEEAPYIYMDMGANNQYYFTQDKRYEKWVFPTVLIEETHYLKVQYGDTYVATLSLEDGITLLEHYTKEPMTLEEAPHWGFKGQEKLGSARGYIWSRSLPLLKETWLVGTGPDSFGFEFPQDDLLAKWYAYGDPNMTVDKVHNLYLQIAIQQGGIALLAFLTLIGAYLVQCIKLYAFKKDYTEQQVIGIALMLAVVGYLGAGLFNDSVVSVAPIFWILLGAGMGMNYLYKHTIKQAVQQANDTTGNRETK